jgi:hypothetical protein
MGVFLAVIGKIFAVLPIGVQIAETVGALLGKGTKTGPAKAEAVKQIVLSSVQGSEIFAGNYIADQAGFEAAIQKLTDGAVAIMNSIKPKTAGA